MSQPSDSSARAAGKGWTGGAGPDGVGEDTGAPGRRLAVAGTYNLRDVGGYPTRDGRRTRWRTLFRSDSLHRLGADAQAVLLGLGLRTIVDLRRHDELAEAPNVFEQSSEVRYVHAPLQPDTPPKPADEQHFPTLDYVYKRLVNEHRERMAPVFAALAARGAFPALVHCTAGKDRTGVVIALLLRLAGVGVETIAADFAATEANIAGAFTDDFRERLAAKGITWERFEHMMICPPHLIVDLLAHVEDVHGGVDGYLRVLGLSDQQLARLRAALVE